jgi:hypothetical protein
MNKRESLERQIDDNMKLTRKKGVLWGISALPIAVFSKERAYQYFARRIEPQKVTWYELEEQLRAVEREENYPSLRSYVKQIHDISHQIPEHAKQVAYYPYAGTDVFWANEFDHVVMEDKNYDTSSDQGDLWWRIKDYQLSEISKLIDEFTEHGLLSENNHILLSPQNSTDSSDTSLNNQHTTLIYKSGFDFSSFLSKRFNNDIQFGAIITSNMHQNPQKIEQLLSQFDYSTVYTKEPSPLHTPWTINFGKTQVFSKQAV